mgnify:CR=1 FL=1
MSKSKEANKNIQGQKVSVKQVRSTAARVQRVKDTLQALGLGRVGKERTIVLNSATEGMIKKVNYLLEVKKID